MLWVKVYNLTFVKCLNWMSERSERSLLLGMAKKRSCICVSVTAKTLCYRDGGIFIKISIGLPYPWDEFEDGYDPIYCFKMAAV